MAIIVKINGTEKFVECKFKDLSSTYEGFELTKSIMNYINENLDEFKTQYDTIEFATKLLEQVGAATSDNLESSDQPEIKIVNHIFDCEEERLLEEYEEIDNSSSGFKIIINLLDQRIIFGVWNSYQSIEDLLDAHDICESDEETFEKQIVKIDSNALDDSIVLFDRFDRFENIIDKLNDGSIINVNEVYYEVVR
ncbi:MAG: hypothetical protein ACRC4M_05285 [Mycoplasma sp.]